MSVLPNLPIGRDERITVQGEITVLWKDRDLGQVVSKWT